MQVLCWNNTGSTGEREMVLPLMCPKKEEKKQKETKLSNLPIRTFLITSDVTVWSVFVSLVIAV